jgi:hypothetical protein
MRAMLAMEQLQLRLWSLNQALRVAVARQTAEADTLTRADLTPYCITEEQVGLLLDRVDGMSTLSIDSPLAAPDRQAEEALREQAAAAGVRTPIDELAALGLNDDELDGLLLCVAPELDGAYERIFAYVLDDTNRRLPCVELLCLVGAVTAGRRLARQQLFGPLGRLRRLGLLRPLGHAPTLLRQELQVVPGLVDFLLGTRGDLALLAHDPAAVDMSVAAPLPAQVDADYITRLGKALGLGSVDLVGVWGDPRTGQRDVVFAVAQAAGKNLRRLLEGGDLRTELIAAAALDAILWLPADLLPQDARIVDLLARSRTPVVLSGTRPWRPVDVLADRRFAEVEIGPPSYLDRIAAWTGALPDLETGARADLAAKYRLSGPELRAVAATSLTEARLRGDSDGPPNGEVARAVAAIVHRDVEGFARPMVPRRHAADLVLPNAVHRTVLEIPAAYRSWPRVADAWGFARTASPGVKALFAGEPGTGKTLAAEVVAGMLGLVMLKVDLARVVSKWVGETEKHLDAAFRQAEDCQAVLFFDEADALFGKRADIQHGVDRYANLEVAYLLQRLEESDSLVILASNLREHIDPAFARRFHFVVHFPRPLRDERLRIWRLAFPPQAPLTPDADLDALANLDMTGAAITSTARSAALLAADENAAVITMTHIVGAIARQYDRDARLLLPSDLGEYATLLALPGTEVQG